MRIEAEPCYVLHARAWRETSLLLEVLSAQHGRIGLVARGVQGPKRQVLRAALQPLQFIRIDALQRGELAQLRSAEALDIAPQLTGDVALAAFYVNELVLRLAPRSDPQPDLFTAYGRVRARLGAGDALAWTLRRFERDLLDALGSGFALEVDGDGNAIDPAARYRFDPEHGPRRLLSDRGQEDRSEAATGRALLALGMDIEPDSSDLAGLRKALRPVLLHHLGGRGLRSWDLLGELDRLAPRPQKPG
jgi:DNA repair protein RecO (recombination protein O)